MPINNKKQVIEVDNLPVGIARISFDGKRFSLIYANEFLYKIFGFTKEEYLAKTPYSHGLRQAITKEFIDEFCEKIKVKDEFIFSHDITKKDNSIATLEVTLNVLERNNGVYVFDACVRDISEFHSEMNKKDVMLDRLVNYDKLTGLPKNAIFVENARNYIENAQENDCFASVYIDINNFKLINEKVGREQGDAILINKSKELEALCKDRGCVCRAFSDKFLLFIKFDKGHDLKKEIEDFIKKFTKQQHKKYPECSISMGAGICVLGNMDFSSSVDYAAIAHKNAKLVQENNCVIFNEKMKNDLNNAMEMTNAAEKAIENREFVVYYQPKVSLEKNRVVGAEALIRWEKPDGTIVPPGMFLPYLEKSLFITKVDFYVYEEVCRLLRHYLDKGIEMIPISVNFSRLHLREKDFIDKVVQMAEKYGIPHKYLELELTENAFLEDEKVAVYIFSEFRKHGFLVSIDDFGSGYSSLNLLKILPVDVLKMDKEFFGESNLEAGSNNAIVVSSIIDMANKMNISIICEGVETAEQIEFLRNTKCGSVQGYYYAKPMPLDEYEAFRSGFNANSIHGSKQ